VGERDRRAEAKPAGNPNSRRGRESEPELRKAGGRPGRKWVKVMGQYTELFVGIDVAKRTLEVALSSGESWTVNNDAAGVARLVKELARRAPALVVLEASGGYEREVWLALIEAGVPTARVNPRDTHHFAQAHRQLAKTDRLDARGLVLFAAQIRPQPDAAPGAADERLKELVMRRQQLTAMPQRRDAKLLQVIRRQARQDRLVNLVLAECRLVSFETEAPQPASEVHARAPKPPGEQHSISAVTWRGLLE